jgi:hypothetical protein
MVAAMEAKEDMLHKVKAVAAVVLVDMPVMAALAGGNLKQPNIEQALPVSPDPEAAEAAVAAST